MNECKHPSWHFHKEEPCMSCGAPWAGPLEFANADASFRSPREMCTHGSLVETILVICGVTIPRVCTQCGLAV